MVMILTKTRENKGADSVTCRTELVSIVTLRFTTLLLLCCGFRMLFRTAGLDLEVVFSLVLHWFLLGSLISKERAMKNDRWGDLSRKCPLQIEQPGTNIWDCLADKGEEGTLWPREATSTCSVTNLIKELSLSDPHSNPSAPPSKRQCRSLSFSDEMSSCRTSWRPLGSKVWTPVEKRRCYSGGSVQRYSNGSATMQRSSSFSLPSRSHPLASSCDYRPGCLPRRSGAGGDTWSPEGGRADMQRSLSCSHDRFSSSEPGPPSASSTPASTPQLGRRAGGLCRSRSQPCVLNDKKVGVKRRRPQDAQEPRPSLDLAKMTQSSPSEQPLVASPVLQGRISCRPGWEFCAALNMFN
ncbi:hypothetical protein CIB84_006965, partial [Bambusicola thoracicus]